MTVFRAVFFQLAACALSAIAASPSAPTGLVATAPVETHVALAWTGASDATGYNIYRSTVSGGETLLVSGSNAPVVADYEDSRLSDGTTYYYKVAVVNASGTSGLSDEACTTTKAPEVTGFSSTAGDSQVVLNWNPSRTATSYRIYRDTAGGVGGATSFFVSSGTMCIDTGLTNGTTYYYQIAPINGSGENPGGDKVVTSAVTPMGNASTGKPAGRPVRISAAVGSPGSASILTATDGKARIAAGGVAARPETGRISFVGCANEPSQNYNYYIPDRSRPVQGALFFAFFGSSIQKMPNLKATVDKYNIIVFNGGNEAFNFFSTRKGPVSLTTADDEGHAVGLMDYRWPRPGARRVQAALSAAARQLGHPEIQGAGLITYGFSEGVDDTDITVVQPPLGVGRLLASIYLSEIDEDRYCPLEALDNVPHLYISSGMPDIYSTLTGTVENIHWVTYDALARGLATNQGAPLTMIDNAGYGHGQNPDNPFVGAWLDDVLSQRLPAPTVSGTVNLPSWRNRSAWAGTYDITLTGSAPWGRGTGKKGVRLVDDAVAAKTTYADPRPFIWLPSRKTAMMWLSYAISGRMP